MELHTVYAYIYIHMCMPTFISVSCEIFFLQEDINVTNEVGRQHILGQRLHEKRGLLRAWILRDHRPLGVRH